MKTIPLTKGEVALVDDQDYERLSVYKWHATSHSSGAYAARRRRVSEDPSLPSIIYMHQQIVGFCSEVDHENRLRLDNQRGNLRPATRKQNCGNTIKKGGGASTYKGVRTRNRVGVRGKPHRKFEARLGERGLGTFKYAHEAALAYDRAALKEWGEFSRLNFPRRGREGRTTILFVGFSGCGKDAASEYLSTITCLRYGFSFSRAALPFMAEVMGVPEEQAYAERHAHREKWKAHLDGLRKFDETLLAEIALTKGEILAGLRDKKELDAARKKDLFSHIIWVDRPGVPVDSTVTFSRRCCDEIIWNDGSLEEYHNTLRDWAGHHNLLPS